MFKKHLIALALVLPLAAAQAQQPASSPAKKDYVARILKMQQPGIEAMARSLVEQPAMELLNNAGDALSSRVAKDKQEAVAKDIHNDIQKYLDDAVPTVQARAMKLAPVTIGSLLEEKFSEDELKQLATIIETPAYIKFQGMGGDMQKVLVEKLVDETRGSIEPKVAALEQTVAKRLGVGPAAQAPAAAAPRAPAKAAKPASK